MKQKHGMGKHLGEEEAEIDLEGELISALEDLDVLRDEAEGLKKENKKLSRELEESNHMVVNLKLQVEEAKRMEEVMKSKVGFEIDRCMKLEAEVVSLIKYLQKAKEQIERGSEILDELLSTQKPANKEKFGLGLERGKNSFANESVKLYERFREVEKLSSNDEKSCKEFVDEEEKQSIELKKSYEVNKLVVDKKNNQLVQDE